ncbi:sirohydrochlorin cobaltochelatase [Desulfogranum mediterraneum]|uniref:sirohydrochlorin cobaltochelatase n=1 Tax=Desulfogranum mediterraneum TaxID=160661 RepID=UPI000410FCBB|nr:sirohydrochlorin cobaltochelatase [Desulfogranum mediterraneum]
MYQQGYIGRKMRLPRLQEEPAIVITAFGSSSQGSRGIQLIRQRLEQEFPGQELFWAYSSEIIRKKEQLPSLQETLAQVEAAGYRKVIVQPLHIFPGTEYQQLVETCNYFPGLRVIVGETLCHRWDFIHQVLGVVAQDFLGQEEGLNLLALHGTPLAADPANIIYLGIEQLVTAGYANVRVASIEGIPEHRGVIRQIKSCCRAGTEKRVRIIPMMLLAGVHVEDDLLGEEESWRLLLEEQGFTVDCPTLLYEGATYYKGLAFRPECVDFFMDRLKRSLSLMHYY